MWAEAKERPHLTTDEDRTGDPIFAARLHERMEKLGLSAREVAALVRPPLSQQAVSTYETGKRDVNTHYKRELARVLQTTVSYLVGETDDYRTPEKIVEDAGLGLGNFDTLPDAAKMAAAQMIEQLRALSLGPPPEGSGQGEPDAGSENPATGAG